MFDLAGAKTILFEQKNILASWYYFLMNGEYHLKMLGFSDIPDKYKTEKLDIEKRYQGIDAKELSQMVIDSHSVLIEDFLSKGNLSKGYSLTSIASIPQVRMTRRIVGICELDDSPNIKHADSRFYTKCWGEIKKP